MDIGNMAPTPSACATMARVPGGTLNPAISAIFSADCPTIFVFKVRRGVWITFSSKAFSACITNVGALSTQLFQNSVLHRFVANDRLFGGTQRSVIKCLAGEDVANSLGNIGRSLDIGWNVSRSDAKRRLSRTVGRLYKTRTSGCQDQ